MRKAPTGRRAVIIGNGGSVDLLPPAAWRRFTERGFLLIGTNRALCFRALRNVTLDAMVIRDRCRNLWYPQKWGSLYHAKIWKPWPGWKVGRDRTVYCDEFVKLKAGWQDKRVIDEDGDLTVMTQNTVVLMAANWAWLRGTRELVLVGVDYCGKHAEMIEPYHSAQMSWQGHYDKPVPQSIEREFAGALRSTELLGGRMVNISQGTKLKAIPREKWQNVF